MASVQDLILEELRNLRGDIKQLREEHAKTREDVAGLKVQAGVAGGLVGFLTALVTALFSPVKSGA